MKILRTAMMAVLGVMIIAPAQALQQDFVSAGCSRTASETLNDAALLGVEREVAVIDQQIDRPQALADLSCLEQIMSSSVDIFFSPPNIGDLISRIQNAVCGAAEDAWANATSPLNQTLYRSVEVGGFVPGEGAIGGGVNISSGRSGSVSTLGIDSNPGVSPVQVPDVRQSGNTSTPSAVWTTIFR
jgi:hypothetical protein